MTIKTDYSSSAFKPNRHLVGCLLLILGWASGFRTASARTQQTPPTPPSQVQVRTIPVANGVYLLVGRGVNIGVFSGEDGVVMVNASSVQMNPRIVEAVAKISSKPIRFVINTDSHEPNTGGNALLGKLGLTIVAHENVRKQLSVERFNTAGTEKIPPPPREALPAVTYTDSITLHFSGEEIYIFHQDSAHSDSDSVVYFRRANVLQTGDLYYPNNYPFIDLQSNGTINGMIAAVDRALKIVDPGAKVIPGRGPVSTVRELTEYRDMFVTVRDRVLSGIRAGKTLEQIVATKPTAEFDDARKGSGELNVERTGATFVKWFYDDLSKTVR